LSNERIRLLNDLDFFWDPYEDLWTKRYEELVEYYKEHGDSMVSEKSLAHKELGRWVHMICSDIFTKRAAKAKCRKERACQMNAYAC
jgi:hypothetical protein